MINIQGADIKDERASKDKTAKRINNIHLGSRSDPILMVSWDDEYKIFMNDKERNPMPMPLQEVFYTKAVSKASNMWDFRLKGTQSIDSHEAKAKNENYG